MPWLAAQQFVLLESGQNVPSLQLVSLFQLKIPPVGLGLVKRKEEETGESFAKEGKVRRT